MIGSVQRDRPPSRLLQALIGLGKGLVLLVDRSWFRATPVLRRPFSSRSEPFLLHFPFAIIITKMRHPHAVRTAVLAQPHRSRALFSLVER
jgi:hypothetical protein